jgi:hypothetical protein
MAACKVCHGDLGVDKQGRPCSFAGNFPIPVLVQRNGEIKHALAPVILVPVTCPHCGAPQLQKQDAPRVIPAVPLIQP